MIKWWILFWHWYWRKVIIVIYLYCVDCFSAAVFFPHNATVIYSIYFEIPFNKASLFCRYYFYFYFPAVVKLQLSSVIRLTLILSQWIRAPSILRGTCNNIHGRYVELFKWYGHGILLQSGNIFLLFNERIITFNVIKKA